MKPLVLVILDGWGLAPPGPGNAISLSKLTHIPTYWNTYPHTQLAASGEGVGLPQGEDGNTETGHINIGAGRVVYQDLPRINMSIADGSFFQNDAFLAAIHYAKEHHTNLHLLGLVGDGGVHSNLEHLYALLTMAKQQQCECPVYLHLFTDGRDSPRNAGIRFIDQVEAACKRVGVGTIATIMGRYYGMDRDRRWERTQVAYEALTSIIPRAAPSAIAAVEAAYAAGLTDEFVEPTLIVDSTGTAYPRIASGDAVIFFNFRIDRPRQLTEAFVLPNFEEPRAATTFDPYAVKYHHKHLVEEDSRRKPFTRKTVLTNIFFVTMTEYEKNLPCSVAFPPHAVPMPMGQVVADVGLHQLRLSETEKERFVTYYFNGMREEPYAGEDRIIVPSPKVATYDLTPAMSAIDLTDRLVDRLSADLYALVVINFANPDMVAHTGNIAPSIAACEVVDECVGRIVTAVLAHGGACAITADHGNVEEMLGPSGEVDTEHSTYPVPFIMVAKDFEGNSAVLPKGKLADIAPTLLGYMGLPIPSAMTGNNLLIDIVHKN